MKINDNITMELKHTGLKEGTRLKLAQVCVERWALIPAFYNFLQCYIYLYPI
jgi:hypothetical protein